MSPVSMEWFERRELIGPTLRLTPLVPGDAEAYLAALGEPAVAEEVVNHLAFAAPRDVSAARRIIEEALATPDRLAYAQRVRDDGELIGTTSFYEMDPSLRSLGIGHTWIAQRYWRTGVNTASKLLMLTRAFEGLGAERVVWHTDINNLRSQAAIERLGATKEGVLRHHRIRRDGSWRDTVQYSMLSAEWPEARQRLLATTAQHASDPGGLEMVRNDDFSRFEGRSGAQLVAVIDFHLTNDVMVITHTGTEPAWRGRGIAGQLTRFALDDIRRKGQRVRPICPYTASYIHRRPGDHDLLA